MRTIDTAGTYWRAYPMEEGPDCIDLPPQKRQCVENGQGTGCKVIKKRKDYLSWDDYFMSVAFLSAQRSKDPRSQVRPKCFVNWSYCLCTMSYVINVLTLLFTCVSLLQVGACIVNQDKKIVGIGYNGMPNGCSDDELPWSREADSRLDTKYPYGKHRNEYCNEPFQALSLIFTVHK